MAEKKITNAQIIEATRNAETYFQDTKNRGKLLVNAGKLSKEDYYKKIREVGIKTRVIGPNEFPGGAPDWLEPTLEIGLGMIGYTIGAVQGAKKLAPQAGGAAGYGVGAGIGQATFDAINKFTADEGQVVKPNNAILNDALAQAGIDASLSYGIDKVIVPGIGKAYQLAKGYSIKSKQAAVNKLKSITGRMTDDEAQKFYKEFGEQGSVGQTVIGKDFYKSKEQSQKIIDSNRIMLESEGMTPTRYQVLAGSGTIGQIGRGAYDAASVIPGASYYGKKSFESTLDDTISSLTNPLYKGSAKNINDRAAYVSGNAFVKDIKGDYIRNPALLKKVEDAYENLPKHAYANLTKISDNNITEYRKFYDDFNNGIKESKFKFNTTAKVGQSNTSIVDEIQSLNTGLKRALAEKDSVKISSELPSMLRKIITPTKKPQKVTGTQVIPEQVTPAKADLTGEEISILKTQLRNLRDNRRVFETKESGLTTAEKQLAGGITKLEDKIISTIARDEPVLASKFRAANSIFRQNNQFLADNEGLLRFGKTLDGKDYNPFVYDGFRDEFRELTGTEFKTILGRGLGKEQTAQEVFKDFMTKPSGIQKLKFIMDKSAKIKLAERRKLQGKSFVEKDFDITVLKPITDGKGNVIRQEISVVKGSEVDKANQEFGELVTNEMEDLFDKTLLTNLRKSGSFDPDSLIKEVTSKKGYYKELIRQAQKTPDLSRADGKFLDNITYDRLLAFGTMFKGFADEPGVSKFLLRRAPLALSSGVTLSKVLPIAGAGAAGSILGIPSFVATMGIINLFNKFISQPLGMSYWQSVKGDKNKLGEFLKAIYQSAFGKDAIKYQASLGRALEQLPRGLGVGALQPDNEYISAPRTREQYESKTPTDFDTISPLDRRFQ